MNVGGKPKLIVTDGYKRERFSIIINSLQFIKYVKVSGYDSVDTCPLSTFIEIFDMKWHLIRFGCSERVVINSDSNIGDIMAETE